LATTTPPLRTIAHGWSTPISASNGSALGDGIRDVVREKGDVSKWYIVVDTGGNLPSDSQEMWEVEHAARSRTDRRLVAHLQHLMT